jgi:hypothetical protein
MISVEERRRNQAAYRELSDFIRKTYAPGAFVAISEGTIVADAADFGTLNSRLHQMGKHSPEVLVVQAGVDYPETATIC